MKESDISYLAGLFDGEGSIYYTKSTEKNYFVKLQMFEFF